MTAKPTFREAPAGKALPGRAGLPSASPVKTCSLEALQRTARRAPAAPGGTCSGDHGDEDRDRQRSSASAGRNDPSAPTDRQAAAPRQALQLTVPAILSRKSACPNR
jgi:hypothetical protein